MKLPCQIINKPKHQRRGNTRNKTEGPTSKKTKEPPKRPHHKGNIKFLKPPPLARSISNKERGGPRETHHRVLVGLELLVLV